MTRVFNFSGGKTSAYMTIKYWQPGDLVIFTDTGREHQKTYKFINDFEAFEQIPVIRVGTGDMFREFLKKKKFKVLPNRAKRICTVELKIRAQKRYLRSIGIREFENYIGFRADEPQRVAKRKARFKKVHDCFPLFYSGVTKHQVNQYWDEKPYNLEIPPILGNCTLCFMKGKDAIMAILSVYPELASVWIEDESMAGGRTYIKDAPIKTLLEMAQNNLFKDYHSKLADISPAYNCACTT